MLIATRESPKVDRLLYLSQLAEKKDLENRLTAERQDRLTMSDRLTAAQKVSRGASQRMLID